MNQMKLEKVTVKSILKILWRIWVNNIRICPTYIYASVWLGRRRTRSVTFTYQQIRINEYMYPWQIICVNISKNKLILGK